MDIIQDLKDMNIDIAWDNDDNGIIGKSPSIIRPPFKFEEELLIMEGDGDIYLRLSCDEENHFWIPVSDTENFLHLYDTYTRRGSVDINEQLEINSVASIFDNPLTSLPFENTVYYYGGLCPNIDKLETKMLFNKYLCHTKRNFKTAPWLTEQPRKVQLDTKNDIKNFHPLFVKINYPTTNHTGIRHKIMGDCMLYDVLDKDMPYDIWAALQSENVFDREKIVEMINGMGDDLKNEKDYLNFVLAALTELNNNP